jgi:WhiB family transcriptional regulator, redox-sensing transcriptional regulator
MHRCHTGRTSYPAAMPRRREPRLPGFLIELEQAAANPDPLWQEQADCVDLPTALFFPTRGQRSPAAEATCATCPVRWHCLLAAVEHRPQVQGIWGGVYDRERRQLRRAWRDRAVAAAA